MIYFEVVLKVISVLRFNDLINLKISKSVYKTWFFKYLGVIYLFLILVTILSMVYANFSFSKAFEKEIIDLSTPFLTDVNNLAVEEKLSNNDLKSKIKDVFYKRNYKKNFETIILEEKNAVIFSSENYNFLEKLDVVFARNVKDKITSEDLSKNVNKKNFCLFSKEITGNKDRKVLYIIVIFNKSSVKNKIFNFACVTFSILLMTMVFLFIISKHFIKSIVIPINNVSKMARCIALGDFKTRILKKDNNELGELCDTINYMAQKLFESERMKNDFVSSISHELRTPLTAIKGWAETIVLDKTLKTEDIEMNKKGLEIIVNEAERLCSIVEELLDFSKLQSGRMILNLEKIDVLAELSEAVYIFRKKATKENKLLLYSEPESLPPILGDKNRLKQVFINIIDNAIKYTSEKGVINVGAKENEKFLKIEISDNGYGISKEDLPKVKNKFYKGKSSKNGSGIGLALANEIILLHSGTLDIKSEENIGTVVTIYLPISKKE